ncbi:MAG: ABC transporter ATP-binding protein [Synergistaceae bacterium]|jgi:iron(III) transport system ATP-binding protein|nr:ABC transporter ATP-binding protein [Synergistaceae bacterium]
MEDIIRVEGLAKRYGAHQVHSDLSLKVRHGECFTLLGPSGCGKTVLLRLIAGFEAPDAGKIDIADTTVSDPAAGVDVSPDSRGIGMVFQDYAVWPHMTVFDNVAYPLKLAKKSKEEIKNRVMETIALVGMTGLEKRLPSELSGGQQQRVALARALVARPSLLLLDEPLTNLDANLREEMRFEIKELQRKLETTVLYVTHDQEVALALSDRLAVMDDTGRIRQTGTPWEIFERPADSFVFSFMGIANFLPVRKDEGGAWLVGDGGQNILRAWKGSKEQPADPHQAGIESGKAFAGFRPSDVRISRLGRAEAGGLRGIVRRASFLGAMMDYLIDVDGATLRTSIETHEALKSDLMFKEGEDCALDFLSLHWFDAESIESVEKNDKNEKTSASGSSSEVRS